MTNQIEWDCKRYFRNTFYNLWKLRLLSIVDRVCYHTPGAAAMAAMTTQQQRILMIFTFRYDQCVIALKLKILQLYVSHSKEQIEYEVNSEKNTRKKLRRCRVSRTSSFEMKLSWLECKKEEKERCSDAGTCGEYAYIFKRKKFTINFSIRT